MGLGSTASKLKRLVSMVEDVFEQMTELRDRVQELAETIEDFDERLDRIEARGKRQEAVLSALAEQEGLDVESLVEDAAVGGEAPAESDTGDSPPRANAGAESSE